MGADRSSPILDWMDHFGQFRTALAGQLAEHDSLVPRLADFHFAGDEGLELLFLVEDQPKLVFAAEYVIGYGLNGKVIREPLDEFLDRRGDLPSVPCNALVRPV